MQLKTTLKIINRHFVIFSGYNQRAVLALCYFFEENSIPYLLVARDSSDTIFNYEFSKRVIYTRRNKQITLNLFYEITNAVMAACGSKQKLIYIPTSEYLNVKVFDFRNKLEANGWEIALPNKELYSLLTSKVESQRLFECIENLALPKNINLPSKEFPLVLKPKINVIRGVTKYPQFILNDNDYNKFIGHEKVDEWFAQEFVEGQSFYICGYIAKNKSYTYYIQENLIQQPNGKSIILARLHEDDFPQAQKIINFLIQKKFCGPFMVELIVNNVGVYYIETNPRFWGPLFLSISANTDLLRLFVTDHGFDCDKHNTNSRAASMQVSYAWEEGNIPNLKIYPSFYKYFKGQEVGKALRKYDLYRYISEKYARRNIQNGKQ